MALMTDAPNFLSAESLEDLKRELKHLKDKKIPEIAKRIDEAKQQGDLSENAEYHQAREDMSWAQGRLFEVERILGNAQVIVKKQTGVIGVGSTITISNAGKTKIFTIVGPQEVNPAKGLISNESPLGEAFLGHKKGDKVEISTPGGKIICTVDDVK